MMSVKERKALAIMESMVQMIGGHYELCLLGNMRTPVHQTTEPWQ